MNTSKSSLQPLWHSLFFKGTNAIHEHSTLTIKSPPNGITVRIIFQHVNLVKLPCPSPAPGHCSNSCPSCPWCHPTISFSVIPFSSCLQSFPETVYFPVSQFFTSGGQSIGVSASTSVFPMNNPGLISFRMDWLDLLARVFSNTTVQNHQFFSARLSL